MHEISCSADRPPNSTATRRVVTQSFSSARSMSSMQILGVLEADAHAHEAVA